MKIILRNIVLLLFLISQACNTPQTPPVKEAMTTQQPDYRFLLDDQELSYDSSWAIALGADEYGMKNYVLAYLKAGPNRDQDSATAAEIQKAHLENIMRMAKQGQLVVAGPFTDDHEVKGIYILNVETVAEAEELVETDPAIEAGRLTMELHPWYGSAALMLVNKIHKKVEKKSVAQ
jgi:hypothetical protein